MLVYVYLRVLYYAFYSSKAKSGTMPANKPLPEELYSLQLISNHAHMYCI